MSARSAPLQIEGPAGSLEALLEEPPRGASQSVAARFAVLCHPHPLHGGTLQNKVVHILVRAFIELGVPSLRFNFRGVGGSVGQYDEGRGELDDLHAVIEWGRRRWPQSQLWLGGFSFGAWIAIRAARGASCARLVTVAPPVARFDFGDFAVPQCPWLIVQGNADQLVDAGAVRRWAASLVPAPQLAVLSGADHFFHGHLLELREAVLAFARD